MWFIYVTGVGKDFNRIEDVKFKNYTTNWDERGNGL
jgi:hypothetical protein